MGSKEIAGLLRVSAYTIAEYRKRICKKLRLHSTAELAACAAAYSTGVEGPARLLGIPSSRQPASIA